jgi:GDP-D-mannose dehydratase
LMISVGNPTKAETKMGWKAKFKMEDVIDMMLFSNLQ